MSDASRRYGGGVREFAPKPRWGRRFLKSILFLALVVVAAHWGWGRYAQSQMESELQRYRALGEPIDPADFQEDAPPDDENGAVDLIAAGESLEGASEASQYNYTEKALPLDEMEMGEIEKMLHNSRDALRRIDAAMAKPHVYWKRASREPTYMTPNPWRACTRNLPDLLRFAALHSHQLGDDRAAMLRIRQLFFMARAVDRDPFLSSHLAAMGIRSMACDAILQIAPDLQMDNGSASGITAADLRTVFDELLDDQNSRKQLIRALQGSRMEEIMYTREFTQGKIDLFWFRNADSFSSKAARYVFRPVAFNDLPIMLKYSSGVIDATRDATHWPGLSASMPSQPEEVRESPLFHCFAGACMTRYERALCRHFQVLTEQHLAAAALAIRCYAVTHNQHLPEDLEDLTPAILPVLPADLMSRGARRLEYHPDAADPILYSVGKDGKDDGGSTEGTGRRLYDSNWSVNWTTRDAVVHLTRQPRIQN